jgi:hypothetical protein
MYNGYLNCAVLILPLTGGVNGLWFLRLFGINLHEMASLVALDAKRSPRASTPEIEDAM